jgi:hypothetical protein
MKLNHQTVGNVGLYYVCYRLSLLGWNVMPTARNARGIDIVAYNEDGSRKLTFQVKALSKRNPVGLGRSLSGAAADFFIIVRRVQTDRPECFILIPEEVRRLAVCYGEGKKAAYWLDPTKYEAAVPSDNWHRIAALPGAIG